MEKDQSEKWNEYQKKLSTNGKNSYPANDAEKEWRASKEAAENIIWKQFIQLKRM